MHLLDIFFPRRCVGCGRVGVYFCPKCLRKIEFIDSQVCPVCLRPAIDGVTHPRCLSPFRLSGAFALAHYNGPMRKAISLIKYKLVSDLTQTLIFLFIDHYPPHLPQFDIFVPVPLHPSRERERGFNQSALVANLLAKKLRIPSLPVLKKIRHTKPQAKLTRKERLINLKNAFSLINDQKVKGENIALIDDVATTFTTLSECAKVLKKAGAKSVWGLVLAHG